MLTDVLRYGVFIEPEGPVRDMVQIWKRRVAERWPTAAYLAHPPHSTLWVGSDVCEETALHTLSTAVLDLSEFMVAVEAPYIFYDDALTGGGQTCAFAVTVTEELLRLQRVLCDAVLQHHRRLGTDAQLPESLRREPFLSSWRAFGYPFVGAHWVPHITVASVPVPRDDPFINAFLGSPVALQMPVRRVGWWRIAGEQHDCLATFPLVRRPFS